MKTKLHLQFLTSLLLLGSATYGQTIGEKFTETNGIEYIISTSTTVEAHFYDVSAGTDVTIPATVDYEGVSYNVTSIGDEAFHNKTPKLTSVTIPDGVTSIGIRAFSHNELTGSITIPNSVTSIGEGAFTNNKYVTEVTLPNGITRIEKYAFAQNLGLTEIVIPASVEYIGEGAFFVNIHIDKVVMESIIPPTVEESAFYSIGDGTAFIDFLFVVPLELLETYENSDLAAIADIEPGPFHTLGLNRYVVTSETEVMVTDWASTTFDEDKGEDVLNFQADIPSTVDIDGDTYNVTAIGKGAFQNKGALQRVFLPETIKSIGDKAFSGNSHLFRITLPANEPPTLGSEVFDYPFISESVTLVVPAGTTEDYEDNGWSGFRDIISLEGQIHRNNTYFWEVTSAYPNPNEVKVQLGGAPDENGHVEIPSEIEYFGYHYFDSMYSVTSIGENAWKDDTSLNSIDIPDSVTSIGDFAFVSCNLTSIDIPDSVTSIGEGAFQRNDLISVKIPDDVAIIADVAFANNQLTEVTIGENATSIGESAFANNLLASVEIPDGVTSIGNNAFQNNELTEVTIGENASSIGESAFADNLLASVEIPDGVTSIGNNAFQNNKLTEVTLPANVTRIDLYAFADNPDLRLVTVEANDDLPRLDKDAFSNPGRDQIDLVVPFGLGTIQGYLDNGWDGFKSISYGIFTVDDIKYGITSLTEVMVLDYTGTSTVVGIPETADNNGATYTLTTIHENAFQNKALANVEIPPSVISIGELAFSDNPDLTLVTVEADEPPALDATAFTNANRYQIDLVVPMGTIQDYLDNGWGGFKSISDGPTDILTFVLAEQTGAATINAADYTVEIEVEFGTELNGLVPTITLSADATISPESGVPRNFTDPVTYTVTAEDGTTTQDWIVTVTVAEAEEFSSETDILTFSFTEQTGAATISAADHTVEIEVEFGTELNGLVPTITLSADATINPESGVLRNFTDPVTYTVTAEDGNTQQVWTVTVTVAEAEEFSSETDILTFSFTEQTGAATISAADHTVEIEVEFGTELNGLVPTITLSADATISPESGVPRNFTDPVTYTVTAEDGTTTQDWIVTITAMGITGDDVVAAGGFSPNGDGVADSWAIENIEDYPNNTVQIFNQWGEAVFEANGYQNDFEGISNKTSNGVKRLPVGPYLYIINYNEPGIAPKRGWLYINY